MAVSLRHLCREGRESEQKVFTERTHETRIGQAKKKGIDKKLAVCPLELFQHHPLIVWALWQNTAKRWKKSWLVGWKRILIGWRASNNKYHHLCPQHENRKYPQWAGLIFSPLLLSPHCTEGIISLLKLFSGVFSSKPPLVLSHCENYPCWNTSVSLLYWEEDYISWCGQCLLHRIAFALHSTAFAMKSSARLWKVQFGTDGFFGENKPFMTSSQPQIHSLASSSSYCLFIVINIPFTKDFHK